MDLQCLNCGQTMAGTKDISLYAGSMRSILNLVQSDGHKIYIPCAFCKNRNYLIKEYGPIGVFFRLSHSEYHSANTSEPVVMLRQRIRSSQNLAQEV